MNLKSFCEFNCDAFCVELGQFRSIKGRLICFKMLFQKMIFLPFVLFFKVLTTLFRAIAFTIGAIAYIASLGSSCRAQELFAQNGTAFAKDLADWICFPLIVGVGFFKLFVGATLTPAVYFQ